MLRHVAILLVTLWAADGSAKGPLRKGRRSAVTKADRVVKKWTPKRLEGEARKREIAKFARVRRMARQLPALRAEVGKRLRRRTPSLEMAVACVFKLMDVEFLRVGNWESAEREETASFGAMTLRKEHVRSIKGKRIHLRFPGKRVRDHGTESREEIWDVVIESGPLARALKKFVDLPSEDGWLFQKPDGDGYTRLTRYDIETFADDYGIVPKDFRTFHSERLFADDLARGPPPSTERGKKLRLHMAVIRGAKALRHSAQVHVDSYVNPTRFGRPQRKKND